MYINVSELGNKPRFIIIKKTNSLLIIICYREFFVGFKVNHTKETFSPLNVTDVVE